MSWQVDVAEILEAIAAVLRKQAAPVVLQEPSRLTIELTTPQQGTGEATQLGAYHEPEIR